jgi:hypothetical protein
MIAATEFLTTRLPIGTLAPGKCRRCQKRAPYSTARQTLDAMRMIAVMKLLVARSDGYVRMQSRTEDLEDDGILVRWVKVGRDDDEADQDTKMDASSTALKDTVLQEAHVIHSSHEPCCPDDTENKS